MENSGFHNRWALVWEDPKTPCILQRSDDGQYFYRNGPKSGKPCAHRPTADGSWIWLIPGEVLSFPDLPDFNAFYLSKKDLLIRCSSEEAANVFKANEENEV